MIIETPTIKDLAGLIIESKAMHSEMGFDKYGNAWEHDAMADWWQTVLTSEHYDIVIAKIWNRIAGVSVVFYPPRGMWHKVNTLAMEMAHHAAPDLPTVTRCRIMIDLLKAMEEKIKARGDLFFRIGYSHKFPAWGDYLIKHGYEVCGTQTVKRMV